MLNKQRVFFHKKDVVINPVSVRDLYAHDFRIPIIEMDDSSKQHTRTIFFDPGADVFFVNHNPTGVFYVGNGWVAGGCWDDYW